MTKNRKKKTDHLIAIYSIFCIGMVYFRCYLVNPLVQGVQNMYGKVGLGVFKGELSSKQQRNLVQLSTSLQQTSPL